MFFLELNKDDARKAYVHFAVGVNIADVVMNCELAELSYNSVCAAVGTHDVNRWFLGPFTHYHEAKYAAEGQARIVTNCEECFKPVQKKPGELMVNVVVFAPGCVDPDILVTFDDELAKQTYLRYEIVLQDEDLLVWQEVPVRAGHESVGFPEPVNMTKYIKLNDLFEWKSNVGAWSTYKVMSVQGEPPHTVMVQRQSGVTGEELVEMTAGQYLMVRLQEMYKEQEKNAVLKAAKPD